jgi:hypothetical protein
MRNTTAQERNEGEKYEEEEAKEKVVMIRKTVHYLLV